MYIFVDNPNESFARIALAPDDESDYENTNRNMRDLDPDYNRITSNTVLTTKYYLENDFNNIIKRNDNYAKGLSLMHLTKVFILLDPPEKEEEYHSHKIMMT